jgi:DNA-binding CsgD family transcriptional regulator
MEFAMTTSREPLRKPHIDTDLLTRLMACDTIEALTSQVQDASQRLGFEHWIYGALMPVTPTRAEEFVINGYPDEWRRHYLESGYTMADPTVTYARGHVIPSLWDDLASRSYRGVNSDHAKLIFTEAKSFGLAKGLSVPLHGLGCLFGIMSYAASDPKHPIVESTIHAEAVLLATYVHQAASLLINRGASEKIRPLTPRERECLKWAAEGKSGWEIAHVLKISERTTVFHLMNACQKLGVMNRQQAVAKALVLGLLEI